MANKRAALSLQSTPDSFGAGDHKKQRINSEPDVDFMSASFDARAALRASELTPPIAQATAVANIKAAEMLLPWAIQEQVASSASNEDRHRYSTSSHANRDFEGSLNAARNKQFRNDMVAAIAASKADAAAVGDIIEQRFTGGSTVDGIHSESIINSLRGWAKSASQVKVHVICHDLLPGVGDKNSRALLAGTVRWFDEKLNILLQPARLLAYQKDDGTTINNPHNQLGWVYIRCHQVVAISPLSEV
ncbi:hypothetical protein TGME49_226520 [Toxoplasma gondii ME49]|uniref:LSM domain protein n=2 Tax=Toxoplasma gondii TaxID=5811 RepID=A0A086KLN6_TOXGO|nr:hypothetical protein TGME49_226520 [Toxoplasma gondii ME49]EPT27148.1 hypothetical protein TGME49_226520 [Toxoplasma gondii ME49]KFG45304.1 LSM domain protein [Toxoplasma gondii GAB2-2007-GAL-DOM2]|eukprot:XP_002366305.1 hypothetical protein TGME49_226520 [Toxoplasma gondii ME49]